MTSLNAVMRNMTSLGGSHGRLSTRRTSGNCS